MGDMGEIFSAMRDMDRRRRVQNLATANEAGWTKHTPWHWSRTLDGDRVDFWPSRRKFRWRGKTYSGDVIGFLQRRGGAEAAPPTSPKTPEGNGT